MSVTSESILPSMLEFAQCGAIVLEPTSLSPPIFNVATVKKIIVRDGLQMVLLFGLAQR
jgi:hypothetical protein